MTYKDKLLHPKWQRKRLEILQRDNFTCTLCGDKETTLHVHHEEYNGNPWDIDNDKLKTLCAHCHNVCHEMNEYKMIKCFKILCPVILEYQIFAFSDNHLSILFTCGTEKVQLQIVIQKDVLRMINDNL